MFKTPTSRIYLRLLINHYMLCICALKCRPCFISVTSKNFGAGTLDLFDALHVIISAQGHWKGSTCVVTLCRARVLLIVAFLLCENRWQNA